MKKSRFSEEQIIGFLLLEEAGQTVAALYREHGIGENTFSTWKRKFGGMTVSEARRLRQLENENMRLKKLLAESMLDNAALNVPRGRPSVKKMVRPAVECEVVPHLQEEHGFSQRRACRLVQSHRASIRYSSKRGSDDKLRKRLQELAQERPRFGYNRLWVLLRREGVEVNHKKVYRLYREEGLKLRPKKGRKRSSELRGALPVTTRAHQR